MQSHQGPSTRHALIVGTSLGVLLGSGMQHAGAQPAAPTSAPRVDAGHATPPKSDNAAPASARGLEEVVVTATRRSTRLQRTAQAITVLNGKVQRARGEQGLGDLQTTVPNVTFNATTNSSQIYIRGIGSTFLNSGGDAGVGFYQDGAYVSDQTTTNTSQFDIDRVEVLRGPQGALYGRNSVGGAIILNSAKPTDTFHVGIDALVGDYGRRESEGYVSGPTGLANTDVRVSYAIKRFDGYTSNELAGKNGAPDRFDDLDSDAFRIQTLTHLPTDGTLSVLYSHYKEYENGPALGVKPYNGTIYPQQAIFGAIPPSDPRAVQANVGNYDLEVSTVNLNYVQPLGEYTLTAIGNYRSGHQTFVNDCDGTVAQDCTFFRATTSEDYFGDVHVASPSSDRFRWILGATYTRFNVAQDDTINFISEAAYFVPSLPTFIPFPIDTNSGGNIVTDSSAVYADLRYQITPVWAITAQGRYSETTKVASEFQVIPQFGANVTGFPSSLRNTFTPFKVGVEGQLTPRILVYADYATANKDGDINLGALQKAPVLPEEVKTEEIGEKATFFDRRLLVNSALFNSDYTDLQISQLVFPTLNLANAPKSNIKGAELEVVVLPVPDLQLSFNGGYLDAKLRKFSNSPTLPGETPSPLLNLAGKDLPNVSPYSLNFDAAYKFPIVPGYVGSVDLQYSARGRVYFNEFNTLNNSQGPVNLVNLSATIGQENGPWKLYGYIHNITNQTYATGATIYTGPLGASRAVSFGPPRLFAVGASYSF